MSHAKKVGARRLTHAAVLTSIALATATVATVGPAQAESASLGYQCSVLGSPYTFPTTVDTDLPATMTVGQSRAVAMVSKVTVPAEVVGLAYGVLGARSADGTAAAKGAIAGPGGALSTLTNLTVARTPVPASGSMVATATGTGAAFHPTSTGTYTLSAGDFTANLNFYKEDGSPGGSTSIPCTAPAAADRKVDTVTVVKAASTSISSAKVKKNHKAALRSLVRGQYGNDPSGKVTFVLKKGRKQVARATSTLNGANVAQTTLKKHLKPGRYVLTTTYAGDANLTPSTDTVRFRVKH